jgi:pyruvate formate lyase activating enzyme
MEVKGFIFDIKRFAVHDGPGIRTVVFFKGCPLSCAWCHNPEGIRREPELVRFEPRCIACHACIAACSHNAREIVEGQMVYHRERCELCGTCLEVCYAGALFQYGRMAGLDEIMSVLRQDEDFYGASGGGVTLSGGEPLAQPQFATALLRECRAAGLHTALDTCGQVAWSLLAAALAFTDLVLYDLKHLDPQQHRHYTGVNNALILENLLRLDRRGVPLEIRIPLVPTVNDGANLEATAAFLRTLENPFRVRLLPYHNLAGSKYQRLERQNRLPPIQPPAAAEVEAAADLLRECGREVVVE